MVSLATTFNGQKNVLNHKENICAKNIVGNLIEKMINGYLKNKVNSSSEVRAGNLLSCVGLFQEPRAIRRKQKTEYILDLEL